jgi:hypothetical protein
VRLVVNRPQDPGTTGEPSAPHADAVRPALTLIHGGRARPRRVGPAAARPRDTADGSLELELKIEEVPIYLRPIPAWVPRLW